jgi:hypothetical protein
MITSVVLVWSIHRSMLTCHFERDVHFVTPPLAHLHIPRPGFIPLVVDNCV